MEGALRLMDVPPDDIDTWLAAQAAAEAKRVRASGGAVAAVAMPAAAALLPSVPQRLPLSPLPEAPR
jgi:cell division protein FtsI (penicillin-binding protein 3)